MKKKVVSMLLALTMAAGLLAGCGGSTEESAPAAEPSASAEAPAPESEPAAEGEKEVLEFYHAYFHEESEWPVAAVMRDIYQDFADLHADGPVTFTPVVVENALDIAANEIAGGSFPDMVDFAGTEVPLAAISQGLVLDMKPYIEAEGLQSKVGINYTMNDRDGSIYTVHDQLTTLGLWYNADLYKEAGAATPDQWSGYEDMAKAMEAIRAYGEADGIYGYSAGQASTRMFNAYMWQLSPEYASSALTADIINSEEFATAFTTIAKMDQANGSAHSTNVITMVHTPSVWRFRPAQNG